MALPKQHVTRLAGSLTLGVLGVALLLAARSFSLLPPGAPAPAPAPPASGETAETRDPMQPGARAVRYDWATYTTADGLPSNKILAVRVDGDRVWFGTDHGLSVLENKLFKTFTVRDGLAHDVVLALEVDPTTGDVWAGTMAGLSRFSAGRFDTFDQLNSGLANNVVYAVALDRQDLWAATASGASRLNLRTREWSIFNENNAPMHEPWTYSISAENGMVYVAAWGGGVLEWNTKTERWRDYTDPDEEMEIDLFPNDGLVHDVTSSLSYRNGTLWVATYFGMNRYDGTRWWGYFDHDSGLVSNFVNFIKADGDVAWICTDKGLNSFDGETWHTYRRTDAGAGEVIVSAADGTLIRRMTTPTAIAYNYVLGVDFQGDAVWLATENGAAVGRPG